MGYKDFNADVEFVDYLLEQASINDAEEIATFATIFREEIDQLLSEKRSIINVVFGIMYAAGEYISCSPKEIKSEIIAASAAMLLQASNKNLVIKKSKKKKK